MARFGPYELLQKLGSGATAEVHLAVGPNKAGAALFALKLLLPHLSERADLRDQLVREARLASSIHHPNVAEVFEAGEAEGRAYVAMEYVRGRPLSALSRTLGEHEGALSPAEACFIVREAALGLHEAHEATDARRRPLGLVHLDVSPRSVIIREDGRIKVVDFGLAKVTAGGPRPTGKIPYTPPEQLRDETCDRRADVFAASAILFELLCQRRLYPGPSDAELIEQALSLPLPDPREHAPHLPPELLEVLARGLERDPERRFQSAAALAEAVRPFVSDDAKGRLASRMEQFFEPLPRTVEEARMAALAQRTSGQSLGAVRPITRNRPRPPDTVEVTAPATPFPTRPPHRTDPMVTDPAVTGPHPVLEPAGAHRTIEELPAAAERSLDPPLSQPEVTTEPVDERARRAAAKRSPAPPPSPPEITTEPVDERARRAAVESRTRLDRVDRAITDPRPRAPAPPAEDVHPAEPEPSDTEVRPPLALERSDTDLRAVAPEPSDTEVRPPLALERSADLRAMALDPSDTEVRPPLLPSDTEVRPSLALEPDQGPEPSSEPFEAPSFTPPASSRRAPPSRARRRLSLQQLVAVMAGVAALGGLGVGLLLKRLTADEPPPPRAAAGASPQAKPARPPPEAPGAARGQVVILAEPMAVVIEGGRELGTTPYVGEHSAGLHRFELRSTQGLLSAQVEIVVQPNEQITRRVTLR